MNSEKFATAMLSDDEQVIRTEPKPAPPPTPGLVEKLEALGFRPFGYEW